MLLHTIAVGSNVLKPKLGEFWLDVSSSWQYPVHYCEYLPPCCPFNCSADKSLAYPLPSEGVSCCAGLHCDIVLADTDPAAGACLASGLIPALCCKRSFSDWLNVSPRGCRLWGELVPLVIRPLGEDVLEVFAFNRSSVSRIFASRASRSACWEETACFLYSISIRWVPSLVWGHYFCSTDCTKPSRLLSMAKALLRSAEKLRAIVLDLDKLWLGKSRFNLAYDWGRPLGCQSPSLDIFCVHAGAGMCLVTLAEQQGKRKLKSYHNMYISVHWWATQHSRPIRNSPPQ